MTRRDIAHALGWNYMTAARTLENLRTQELVQVIEGGVPRRYRVVPQGLLLLLILDCIPTRCDLPGRP